VNDIVRSHGGVLELSKNELGGAGVRVALPRDE
jgi:nitrogen fixation/metabolism regulation signal transduction histidine kinase